jgi:hypothetical protein
MCVMEIALFRKTEIPFFFCVLIFFIFSITGPQDTRYVYCLFYFIFVPLRWIYYRYKKWHYYLLVSVVISYGLL